MPLSNSLKSRAERYIASHDLCPEYSLQLRRRITSWVVFLSTRGYSDDIVCPITVSELTNEWLLDLKQRGVSPHTVDGYRRAFLAVWNNAEDPDPEHPPLRLRKIKKPRAVVRAFTHDDIKALLHIAERLKGRHPDGNFRRDYWVGVIEAAYSTGLRRGDLIAVRWASVGQDGRCRIIQHKTGFPIDVRFSEVAMTMARRLEHTGGLMFPWPYHVNVFTRTFKRIADAAKADGSFKYLRRSAGSYAENVQAGNGAKALGHRCPKVFYAHYDDPTISQPVEITPPPIR